jgi:hypothetical protein
MTLSGSAGGRCLFRSRAQYPLVSEVNMLCEDTRRAKNVALHASFVKLYMIFIISCEEFTNSLSRYVLHKR